MTTLIKFIVGILSTLLLTSCAFDINLGQVRGDGNVVSETYNLDQDFTGIKTAAGWEVYAKKGDENKAIVETDANLLDVLVLEVRGNTLHVSTDGNISKATSRKIYVTHTGNLDHLKASSGGDIVTRDIIKGESLDLDVSSGGSIKAEAVVRNITLDASSGGNIKITGSSDDVEADVSSGGSINARELKANNVDAAASSGGNVDVYAKKFMKGRASSGGDVDFWGNPENTDIPKKRSMSGGSVSAKN